MRPEYPTDKDINEELVESLEDSSGRDSEKDFQELMDELDDIEE